MNKEHPNISKYKKNYEQIKRGLETFSSNLIEFLHFEQGGISEKGVRNLLEMVGRLRQNIYANSRENKELFFHTSDAIEQVFKPAIEALKEKSSPHPKEDKPFPKTIKRLFEEYYDYPRASMFAELDSKNFIQVCDCEEFKKNNGILFDSQDLRELGVTKCPCCKKDFKIKRDAINDL